MKENVISSIEIKEIGRVKQVAEGVVKADGLPSCLYGQIVCFEKGEQGLILGFNTHEVVIIVFGDYTGIKIGDIVTSTNELLNVPVGESFLGRSVDCLAEPIDDKGPIESGKTSRVFDRAPGIMARVPIFEQIVTGIKMIDLMVPIGKGQRELILGDRQCGKTSIALDVMITQGRQDMICIYCFIGGSYANFKKIFQKLYENGVLDSSIMVCASAASSPAEQFVAPYTAITLGEYFMNSGKDVIVVFDDLTKHAWAYREISLLLERAPGREAYPGDIFFIHSQLMERAAKLSPEFGSGSMSFLPIVETLQGDITGYVPSNLVSMTDGQLFINSDLFREGIKPAIDVGLSVSRLGTKIQSPALLKLSTGLRLDYLQFRQIQSMMRLKTGISLEAQETMRRGRVLEDLFIQENYFTSSYVEEVILFYAFKRKILEVLPVDIVSRFKRDIYSHVKRTYPEVITSIEETRDLTEKTTATLDRALVEYVRTTKR